MRTKEIMYPMVTEWMERSERKAEFCQRNSISQSCLGYWVAKYKKEKDIDSTAGFVPIQMKEKHTTGKSVNNPRVELDLPLGIVLRIFE